MVILLSSTDIYIIITLCKLYTRKININNYRFNPPVMFTKERELDTIQINDSIIPPNDQFINKVNTAKPQPITHYDSRKYCCCNKTRYSNTIQNQNNDTLFCYWMWCWYYPNTDNNKSDTKCFNCYTDCPGCSDCFECDD